MVHSTILVDPYVCTCIGVDRYGQVHVHVQIVHQYVQYYVRYCLQLQYHSQNEWNMTLDFRLFNQHVHDAKAAVYLGVDRQVDTKD
jgi:hypothetical protein